MLGRRRGEFFSAYHEDADVAQKKKRSSPRPRNNKQGQQEGILKEAWAHMSRDFEKWMPEKLRERKDKKKFALWVLILELVILAAIGYIVAKFV